MDHTPSGSGHWVRMQPAPPDRGERTRSLPRGRRSRWPGDSRISHLRPYDPSPTTSKLWTSPAPGKAGWIIRPVVPVIGCVCSRHRRTVANAPDHCHEGDGHGGLAIHVFPTSDPMTQAPQRASCGPHLRRERLDGSYAQWFRSLGAYAAGTAGPWRTHPITATRATVTVAWRFTYFPPQTL